MKNVLTKALSTTLIIFGIVLGIASVYKTSNTHSAEVSLPDFVHVSDVPMIKPKLEKGILEASLSAQLTANSVYVMDVKSASSLFKKNEDMKVFPASTAKMMTALVSRQQYPLEDFIEISPEILTEGNVIGLLPGDRIRTDDLLRGLLIFSGNDAAETLASHYPRGRQEFIQLMNTLATQLHLDKTHFSNPSGIDDPSQTTTARDLTLLAKEIILDDFLSSVVSTQSALITTESGHTYNIFSTNYLLKYPEYSGVKTGTTELAGEVLITRVKINGREVIITILQSEDRYQDTLKIVDWIKSNYTWVPIEQLKMTGELEREII